MARKKNDVVNNGEKTKKKPNGCDDEQPISPIGAFLFGDMPLYSMPRNMSTKTVPA